MSQHYGSNLEVAVLGCIFLATTVLVFAYLGLAGVVAAVGSVMDAFAGWFS